MRLLERRERLPALHELDGLHGVRAPDVELVRLAEEVLEPLPHLGFRLGRRVSKSGTFAKFCNFLVGSFSAVSKRKFARKYAFYSIFQALQDLHTFAPLQSQNFRKKSI